MGRGERIEILKPCPLTPSSKRSFEPQGIKKSLNLHFRPNPILVTVSLALILMAIGPVIFWMLIPDEAFEAFFGGPYGEELWVLVPYWFACFMWFGVITLLAGLIMRKSRPNSLYPPIVVDVSRLLILMVSGLVISYMLIVLLQIPVFLQQAVAVAFIWILFTLLPGFFVIADRIEEREGRREERREKREELKHLKTAFLVVLLIVIGVAITPQFAETAGEDSSIMNLGEASSIMNLEGPRIWIFGEGVPDPPVYTISANEYAHVHHGWNSRGQYYPKINWSELSEFEMNEFIGTSTFELTINGDPVELSCARWLDMELDVYFVIYYIQFKPGDLATGTHTFIGTWYSEVNGTPYTDESGTCPITLNVTVNVV